MRDLTKGVLVTTVGIVLIVQIIACLKAQEVHMRWVKMKEAYHVQNEITQ